MPDTNHVRAFTHVLIMFLSLHKNLDHGRIIRRAAACVIRINTKQFSQRSDSGLLMAPFVLPAYLAWPARFCTYVTLGTWGNSITTSNVSQVDRIWTFMPTLYSAYFALLPLMPNKERLWLLPYVPKELAFAQESFSTRALLMLGLISLWMLR